MKLSFISDGLTEEDMDFAVEAGFQGIEANVHIPLVGDEEDKDLVEIESKTVDVRRSLDEHGLEMAGLGVWQLNFIDERVQERCLNYYSRILRVAERLGCSVVYHGTGKQEGASGQEQFRRYSTIAPTIINMSKRYNIQACIYSADMVNFAWNPIHWIPLFSTFPELGLKYDPSHLFHKRMPYYEPLVELLKEYPNRICHVHIKDVLLLGEGENEYLETAAGMGQISYNIIIGILHAFQYQGFLSLEPHGAWNRDQEIRQTCLILGKKYLERFIP